MKIKIQTKRIYDKKERKDGFRVLVMRLWPRGIRMTDINLWLRDLGPTRPLLSAYRAGKVRWPTFEKRYLEEIETEEAARKALSTLAQGIQGRTVTLLCACKDLRRCHTAPLKRYLTRWTGRL
jgi:uncharacterized protein YeaO (DUF488 family)